MKQARASRWGQSRRIVSMMTAAPCALLLGCSGEIDTPVNADAPGGVIPGTLPPGQLPQGDFPSSATDCSQATPGPSPLRRLTHREYDNTVRDLLGNTSAPATGFTSEEVALGFDNNATARGVTTLLAEDYKGAAERLAASAVENITELTGCSSTAADADTCAAGFIADFASRAYRRPANEEDLARLNGLYTKAKGKWGFEKAIELTLQAILQSPHFLYRVEFGAPEASGLGVKPLAPYELATRLSYLLWGTMPDQPLLDAAASGQLVTREQVATQARRMLQDERVEAVVENFHRQWLALDRFDTIEADEELFPEFNDALKPLMQEETTRFVNAVLWEGDATLSSLLTAPFTYMNRELAEFQGISSVSSEEFQRVDLDPNERIGVLTQAGVLASHSHVQKTSPVLRGLFVRHQFLCNPPPPPPPDVDFTAIDQSQDLSVREQLDVHRSNAACAACHDFMDPIGFGFEHYDAVGRYRDQENGQPVDATGELIASDVDGPFDGAIELAHKLAASEQVSACVVSQWRRFAYGRAEVEGQDTCNASFLEEQFRQSGGNVIELLFSLTQADAFMYKSVAEGEAP